ncbi:hypothetical protein [Streptomyces sp. IB2014 016-6]|uniref:hypothetical protein n=1 Tax=Streptomyces sp. IB2014 016-6 TaxID=2517818 RepID=UPI0011C94EFD|nr:hypothetical protein [Streptomyces sp. IB2014 016-6]TXL84175.1 hypothetical protein EW053_35025 [Streptomyces sp. IB2014 016-6]
MNHEEPDFWVLEYVTITLDPRTGLVVAIGGTEQVADILQRSGFVNHPGPRGEYHRLPHGLTTEEQRLKATAASHALTSAGHSVHLDPALNLLVSPDSDREAALRYLAGLAERASDATSGTEVAEVLTAVAAPTTGVLPLVREVVLAAWITLAADTDTAGAEPEPVAQLADSTEVLLRTAHRILLARNHAARAPERMAPGTTRTTPVEQPSVPAARRR